MVPRAARSLPLAPSHPLRQRWRTMRFHWQTMTGRMGHGISHASRAVRPRTRVLFYPRMPGTQMIAWKLCRVLGWGITGNPDRRADIVFRWDKATFAEDDEQLDRIAAGQPVVNHACLDISKDRVNEVFEKAFGYPLGIDPRTHVGPC